MSKQFTLQDIRVAESELKLDGRQCFRRGSLLQEKPVYHLQMWVLEACPTEILSANHNTSPMLRGIQIWPSSTVSDGTRFGERDIDQI